MDITIYKLTNKLTGMGYVGATNNFERRMAQHRRGKGKTLLANAIREFGWENFTAEVIEICAEEVAPERERYWIKQLHTKEPQGSCSGTNGWCRLQYRNAMVKRKT